MAKMSQMERDDIIVAVITGIFGSLLASIIYAIFIQKQINALADKTVNTQQTVQQVLGMSNAPTS